MGKEWGKFSASGTDDPCDNKSSLQQYTSGAKHVIPRTGPGPVPRRHTQITNCAKVLASELALLQ